MRIACAGKTVALNKPFKIFRWTSWRKVFEFTLWVDMLIKIVQSVPRRKQRSEVYGVARVNVWQAGSEVIHSFIGGLAMRHEAPRKKNVNMG